MVTGIWNYMSWDRKNFSIEMIFKVDYKPELGSYQYLSHFPPLPYFSLSKPIKTFIY